MKLAFRYKIHQKYVVVDKEADAAPPEGHHVSQVYYHGTKTTKAANMLWRDGIKPDLSRHHDDLGRPIEGRVYITRNIAFALHYALGAAVAGTESKEFIARLIKEHGKWGYIAVIPGRRLKDIHADEDQIGQAAHDALTEGKLPWLKKLAEKHLDVEDARLSEYQDEPLIVLEQVKEGNYDAWILAGKILMDYLSPEEHLAIIDLYGNIAHEGVLRPTELWRIDRELIPQLKPDGSNFFALAEKIKQR
jgi:hypothetical protein